MKRIRHSREHIIRKLREADAELAKGTAIPKISKALGIAACVGSIGGRPGKTVFIQRCR